MAREKADDRSRAPGQQQHDREEQYGGFGAEENEGGQPSERARETESPGRTFRENRDEQAHQDTRDPPGQGPRGQYGRTDTGVPDEAGGTRAGRESGEAGEWSQRTFGQADFGQGTWSGSGAARTSSAADAGDDTPGRGGTGEGMHGQPNYAEGEKGFSNFNQSGAGGQQAGGDAGAPAEGGHAGSKPRKKGKR